MAQQVITLSGIGKRFEDRRSGRATVALEDFSLSVAEREFVCLLGPSGCGKSTVLDILAGFETPTAGHATIDGAPIGRPGPGRGIVFQQPALFPWLSVIDNITFAPRLAGVAAADYRPHAEELIEVMGLSGFEHHAPYELSGGMRQRVAIARAWISQPRILLMDEPFGALDAQTRLDMQELLLAARERTSATIVFVTHDVEEALFLADRIVIMGRRPGRVVLELDLPFARPRNYAALVAEPQFGALKGEIIRALRHAAGRAADGLAVA
jgi:NitT/TauT family transport system ATP-binding protein